MSTAAIVVIGNEILTGKFADENAAHAIGRLRRLGCDLKRIVVIADDLQTIAEEVRHCARAFTHVVTSGGVGPTHDDVTLEGVALAFERPLVERAELIALMARYNIPTDAANRRMATLPEGAELVWDPTVGFPSVRVENVWVLPGVPKLFRAKFDAISVHFAGVPIGTARVYVDEWETDLASRLTAIAARHPAVDIGSYPRFGEADFKVILTLESRDPEALHLAFYEVRSSMSVVRVDEPRTESPASGKPAT